MRYVLAGVWLISCIYCGSARLSAAAPPPTGTSDALRKLLKSPDARVRWEAAEALWRLEHRAAELVPVYAQLLKADDSDVRAASTWRLGRLGRDARPAVPALAVALGDGGLEVRVQAGQALANLGELAEPALPALVRAVGDSRLDETSYDGGPTNILRSPALPALLELQEKAIPLLIKAFRKSATGEKGNASQKKRAREAALRAAHVFAAFGRRGVPALLRALKAKDRGTRLHAAIALREVADASGLPDDAVDQLEKRLNDPDRLVRLAVARAMTWIRPASTKAVAVLARAREDGLLLLDDQLRGERERLDSEWLVHLNGQFLADLGRMAPHNEEARKLLSRLSSDKNADTARGARRVLASLGPPAKQRLRTWCRELSHADASTRAYAVRGLGKLGARAKPALAGLRELLAKETCPYRRGNVLEALAAIGPDEPALVPLLIKSLADEGWVRYRAMDCLERLGPKANKALPTLAARLLKPAAKGDERAPSASERSRLVEVVGRIAPGSARAAAVLLKALRHSSIRAMRGRENKWFMRDRLEDGLYAALPGAAPLLREALKDKDDDLRRSAALVLVRAGLDTKTALPILMDDLWGGEDGPGEPSRFQRRVVTLLSRRGATSTAEIGAAFCKAWQTAHPKVRAVLNPGLLVLQSEALPHLLTQLREAKSAESRRALAHLLARFEGQSKVVLPVLRKELRGPKLASQYSAARALALLGPDAAEAVPELVSLLNSPHPEARAAAARALANIGRAAKPAVPRLKAMLKGPEKALRLLAADALSRIDPDVSEAFVFLRGMMLRGEERDAIGPPKGVDDGPVASGSVQGGILRFGARATPALSEVLDNVDLDKWSETNVSSQCGSPVRVKAALMLAELGPEAKKAIPALVRALDDKDPYVRHAAASALGRIGPAAKEAAPAFIAMLDRQNRQVATMGTWGPSSRAGGHARTGKYRYQAEGFALTGLGRLHLFRTYPDDPDPYRDRYEGIRASYPFDAPFVLGRIDARECSALPVLGEAAKNPTHPARLAAALCIWRCGRESPGLLPALKAAFQNDSLSREARECLAELGPGLKPVIDAMKEWLKRQWSISGREDATVVTALGQLGAGAKSAAGLLRPMLKRDDRHRRRRVAAALALYRILGDAGSAFAVLRQALLDQEERGHQYYQPDQAASPRVYAARALGVLAEKGDKLAAALIVETAKGDENPYVRVAALEAMGRLKETNAAAVRGLCAVLRHEDARVRGAAASACGRLGALAKASEKALKLAVWDGHLAVRQAAMQALEAVE